MSAIAVGWVWEHSPYRTREFRSQAKLLVHLAIADVVNDANENEFYMSTYNLARKIGEDGEVVSRNTCEATLRELVRLGCLEVIEHGGAARRPTRYRFHRPPSSQLRRLASQMGDDSLANSVGANLKENPIDEPKGSSQLKGLAAPDCFDCHGTGVRYYPGSGADGRCQCTKEVARSERDPDLTAVP